VDLQGKEMMMLECEKSQSMIDVSGLSAGTYLIRIWNNEFDYSEKIIISGKKSD